MTGVAGDIELLIPCHDRPGATAGMTGRIACLRLRIISRVLSAPRRREHHIDVSIGMASLKHFVVLIGVALLAIDAKRSTVGRLVV